MIIYKDLKNAKCISLSETDEIFICITHNKKVSLMTSFFKMDEKNLLIN